MGLPSVYGQVQHVCGAALCMQGKTGLLRPRGGGENKRRGRMD